MDRTERMACGLVELKFDAADGVDAMSFSGYGAVFKNVDSYGDVIDPGAFASYLADVKSKKRAWPAMLSQHGAMGLTSEDMTPVGIWTELSEDGHGLKVAGKLADTPRGRELYQLMKMSPRAAIDGLSIGYIAKKFTMGSKPGEPRRKLHEIDLMEISPVTFPANGKARVGAVKSIEELATVRDLEEALCERFSKSEALALIARAKTIFADPGDPDGNKGGPGDPEAMSELLQLAQRRSDALRM
jgi:HK97 family phage prohead protease